MKAWPFLLAFYSATALGLCLPERFDPVAWNYRGTAVLIHRTTTGPEGGGSSSYLLLNVLSQQAEEFYLSSNYHNGVATAQRIDEAECRRHVASANKRMGEVHLKSRFKTGPLECRAERMNMLELNDTPSLPVPKGKAMELVSNAGVLDPNLSVFAPKNAAADFPAYLVVSNNGLCGAKYFIMLYSPVDKSYKVFRKF